MGAPKVSYRESPTKEINYDYKHKKQSGGSGQFAHIKGTLSPIESDSEDSFEFEENIVGGRIPKQYIPAVEKGFRDSLGKGPTVNIPWSAHGSHWMMEVSTKDSSKVYTAAQGCFREYFKKAGPKLLEPIMNIEIECPKISRDCRR